MKLVKFLPAVTAALVLAACSDVGSMAAKTDSMVKSGVDAVDGAASAVSNAASATGTAVKNGAESVSDKMTQAKDMITTRNKSVVYTCQNNTTVTATYGFQNNLPKGAKVLLGKNTLITDFVLDEDHSKKTDTTTFVSGDYVWSVESGLTQQNLGKIDAIMLYKTGAQADEILAKNCSIVQFDN
ncbi:DUF7606 domain-containing protein [Otariodibacter oris]|uniref:ACP-like domain-containing protein n=1 Tax=Otariodibacter oris TaxID=1032623 RepID=A0A420XIJ4_9PAST|nr:hypothetical protein [Otariodibacter oris]QGM80914.1 hypothetical protein A6A10_05615 [Otariodibacter oris]RKR76910.1 hypothetical protein DES31_0219 [Otariodibacter oris]